MSIFSLSGKAKSNVVAEPDFNYPAQVTVNAEALLKKGMAENNADLTGNALLQLAKAKTSISPDSLVSVINLTEKIHHETHHQIIRAVTALLEASFLNDYYEEHRWQLNGNSEVEADGGDITLWTETQFRDTIAGLCREAVVAAPERLYKTKVEEIANVIKIDDVSRPLYETALSAIGITTAGILKNYVDSDNSETVFEIEDGETSPINLTENTTLNPANAALTEIWRCMEEYIPVGTSSRIGLILAQSDNGQRLDTANQVALYEANKATEYAGLLLIKPRAIANNYELLKTFIKEHEDFAFRQNMLQALAQLESKEVSVDYPTLCVPGNTIPLRITAKNVNDIKIAVYYSNSYGIENSGDWVSGKEFKKHFRHITSVDGIIEGTPLFEGKTILSYTPQKYGVYIFIVQGLGENQVGGRMMRCTDLTSMSLTGNQKQIYSVNLSSGAPQEGVKFRILDNESNKPVSIPLTNAEGMTLADGMNQWINLRPTKGNDRFAQAISLYGSRRNNESKQYKANINTSLALYHPGDSMEWSVVVLGADDQTRFIGENMSLQIKLYNANNQEIESCDVTTDVMGRARGAFKLPETGLTGRFSLRAVRKGQSLGATSFVVSDYKLPTFEVKIDTLSISEGGLIMKATAKTYSGFPVTASTATLTLSNSEKWSWWRGSRGEREVLSREVETDDTGAFVFTLAMSELEDILPYRDGLLTANLTVIAASGESREASMTVALSKSCRVEIGNVQNIKATKSVELPIYALNTMNEQITAPVELTFIPVGDDKETSNYYKYRAVTSVHPLDIDLTSLPSGSYSLKVKGEGDSFDEESDNDVDIVVYRDNDIQSPSTNLLWTPLNTIDIEADKTVIVRLGTIAYETFVLKAITYDNKILSSEWLKLSPGMHAIDVEMPDSINNCRLILMTINEGKGEEINVDIRRADPTSQLKVEVENLRTYTTAGAKETLTLKLTDGSGTLRQGAAILDIYCKALDAITPYRMGLSTPYIYKGMVDASVQSTGIFTARASWTENVKVKEYPYFPILCYSNAPIMVRGGHFANMSMTRMSKNAAMMDEVADTYSLEETAVMDYGVNMDAGVITEDSEEAAEAENGKELSAQNDPTEYRPAEIPLALFAPEINIGDDGKAEVSWTVPAANTTWALNLVAWTQKALTTQWTGEVVASKPVMVSVNTPRFLRQGDNVEIVSTINNAMGSVAQCTTEVRFCNPFTGKDIIVPLVGNVTIESGKSATFTAPLTVDADWSGVVVKVSVKSEGYTDAEMHIIPVLPATQVVVDSSTFYLAPDEPTYDTEVAAAGEESEVALSFTANPIWEVVAALPGLRAEGNLTSITSVDNLFSILVAKRIIEENPEVADGIAQMAREQKRSKLESVNQLAQLDLASTPWVEIATDENEQLSRLYSILDEQRVNNELISILSDLKKFQNRDGGFRWSNYGDRSSVWATEMVMQRFAQLTNMNIKPTPEQSEMIMSAMNYLEANVRKTLADNPMGYDETFASLCASIKDYKPSATVVRANERAYKAMSESWKAGSIAQKAIIAKVLYQAGYKQVANDILASVSEFSTYSKTLGRFFDGLSSGPAWARTPLRSTAEVLSAFAQIQPESSQVDELRQWLLLAKLTTDWGDSPSVSAVVSAIINSGSRWVSLNDSVEVALGDTPIVVNKIDKLSGSIQARLNATGGDLSIVRTSQSPAWGAVTVKAKKAMRSIKAASTDEISIEKQIIAQRKGKWVITDKLELGETVKVRLIVTSKRLMDYVSITDNRAATFEPVIITPRVIWAAGMPAYLENRDATTNIFFDRLPKGKFVIEYEMKVNNCGDFSAGVAAIQCQQAPEFTAHSAAVPVTVISTK